MKDGMHPCGRQAKIIEKLPPFRSRERSLQMGQPADRPRTNKPVQGNVDGPSVSEVEKIRRHNDASPAPAPEGGEDSRVERFWRLLTTCHVRKSSTLFLQNQLLGRVFRSLLAASLRS